MSLRMLSLFTALLALVALAAPALAEEKPRTIVLIAGKPSHPPGMHEFNAGVLLLEKCLKDNPAVKVKVSPEPATFV